MDDRIMDLVGNFEGAFQSRWIRLMSCNQIAVTGFEAKLLLLISRHADCSQHALATLVSRDKAQIARAIKDLEMKGYLNRSPHKPNGRILKLNLTSEGASVCEKLKIYRAEILSDMLSGLSSDEKLTFEKLLARAILEPRWNK